MKILLINPPQVMHKRYGMPYVFQPLGLLYVAATLERENDVRVIDASLSGWKRVIETDSEYRLGLGIDELKGMISAEKPDIVGISVPFSLNARSAYEVASAVKEVGSGIVTVAGGVHVSVRPEEVLGQKNIDYVVIGEGETVSLELVRAIRSGGFDKLKEVKGIGYKEDGNAVVTKKTEVIEGLNNLAFPARHLVPMEEYFKASEARRSARDMFTYSNRSVSIMTSRGCPFECNFCSIHLTMGRKFRARTPENVLEEIGQLVKTYKIKHLNIEDDNLTFDRSRAGKIFDLITENKFGITWSAPNGIRADTLDESLVIKMKNSGCMRVFVAPESGSQRVVNEVIGKKMDLKKIEAAVVLLAKHNISVDGSFIIGLPGETKKEIKETIKYALKLKKMGMSLAGFHIATPYYGTKLYEQAKNLNLLRKDAGNDLFSTFEPLIGTNEWTPEELSRLQKKASRLVNGNFKERMLSPLRKNYPRMYNTLRVVKRGVFFVIGFPLKVFSRLILKV